MLQQVQQAGVLAAVIGGERALSYCLSRVPAAGAPPRRHTSCPPLPAYDSRPLNFSGQSCGSSQSSGAPDCLATTPAVAATLADDRAAALVSPDGRGSSAAGRVLGEAPAAAEARAQQQQQGKGGASALKKANGKGVPGKENSAAAVLVQQAPRGRGGWWRLTSGW